MDFMGWLPVSNAREGSTNELRGDMEKALLVFSFALMLATGQAQAGWWDDPQEGAQRRASFWQGQEEMMQKAETACMRADEALEIMLGEGMKKVFADSVGFAKDTKVWVEFWMVATERQARRRWMIFSRHNGQVCIYGTGEQP